MLLEGTKFATNQIFGNMAVKQYPHYLFIFKSPEAYQDEKGNWVTPTEPVLTFHSKCREEVNSGQKQIQVGGGEYNVYKSVIQLPKIAKRIKEGSQIVVTDDDEGAEIRLKGTVLLFDKAQLHSRIWV